jgi:putative toxin-antitoxin system antitoxin component (TIGR02293 family)
MEPIFAGLYNKSSFILPLVKYYTVAKGGNSKNISTRGSAANGKFVTAGSSKAAVRNTVHYGGVKEKNIIQKTKGNAVVKREKGVFLKQDISRSGSQMTAVEKMEATRAGISKAELEGLKEKAGLDYDQLAQLLDVSRATLINKKGAERFAPSLSERIMSLADIYSYGYDVFGGIQQFNEWIFQPIQALGGKAPYDLLDNQYGREEVRNVIGRIDYGVYS